MFSSASKFLFLFVAASTSSVVDGFSPTIAAPPPFATTVLQRQHHRPPLSPRSTTLRSSVSATAAGGAGTSSKWYNGLSHRVPEPATTATATASSSERLQQQRKKAKKSGQPSLSNAKPSISELDGRIGFEEFLWEEEFENDEQQDRQRSEPRISVVLFYAKWCKSCAKFKRLYEKLAASRADRVSADGVVRSRGSVRLAQMEWSAHTATCRSLGVKKLPTVHFYLSGEKVAGYSVGPSQFRRVLETVEYYSNKDFYEQQSLQSSTAERGELEDALDSGTELLTRAWVLDQHRQELVNTDTRSVATAAAPAPSLTSSEAAQAQLPTEKKRRRRFFGIL